MEKCSLSSRETSNKWFNQGLYPPGSIVKMITQSRVASESNFDPNEMYKCDGSYQFGDRLLDAGGRVVMVI